MLHSEKSSNNEEDESTMLLGKDMCLSVSCDKPEFALTPEEVLQALSFSVSVSEQQGMVYFAGYLVRKNESMHKGDCSVCARFGSKVSGPTPLEIQQNSLFLWLKKYDEKCSLYHPSQEFVDYVCKMSLFVDFCFTYYLCAPKVLKSMTSQAIRYIWAPEFCCEEVKAKTASLLVRTLFHYKLKWANDTVRSSEKRSKRKLRIFKHSNF